MAHAVSHLQNPLFSTAVNFPHGLNLMTNTATPLLGVLASPLTWLAGPLATYVVLLELGFALTALSAAICARRLGAGWWASWFVGAVFGFCAHRMVEGSIHVFLAFDVVMPWVLYGAIRFGQRRWSPLRFGLITGALVAVDFLISTERVGIELFALILVAALDLLATRTYDRAREIVTGYGLVALVVIVAMAVPLWYFFFGPQSIHGAPHEHVKWGDISLSQLFQPGPYAWWAPFGHSKTGESLLQGPWNSTGYLGFPLVALAIIGVVRNRRDALIRGIAIVTAIFGVMALGPTIRLSWLHLSIWSPYHVITHLPGVQDILPFRYMEIVVLGLAWLAAGSLRAVNLRPANLRKAGYPLVVVALAVLTIVTLIPNQTMQAASTSGTSWLKTPAAARALPANTAVLTYPYAATLFNTPMLDQVQSGLWYNLVGGQAIVPGPNGHNTGVVPLEPSVVFDVLYRFSQPNAAAPINSFPFPVGPLPPLNAATAQQFRSFVTLNHVNEVFWRLWGYHPYKALSYLTAAFGPGRSYAHGTVRVWHVGS